MHVATNCLGYSLNVSVRSFVGEFASDLNCGINRDLKAAELIFRIRRLNFGSPKNKIRNKSFV